MQKLFGRINKVHGCEGAVTVRIEKIFFDNIPEMESVFLEIEGRQVPFFIEHYQASGHENMLLWLSDYLSVEKVKEFIGCRIFIDIDENTGKPGIAQNDIIGFEISTNDDGLVGIVTRVTENPGQWLITVKTGSGNEILIPFHEDLIVSVDQESKKIIMILPEGLDNLN